MISAAAAEVRANVVAAQECLLTDFKDTPTEVDVKSSLQSQAPESPIISSKARDPDSSARAGQTVQSPLGRTLPNFGAADAPGPCGRTGAASPPRQRADRSPPSKPVALV